MARSREVTTYHTGQRGYAVLPRPDVLRPDSALAWAENVWLGNGAGIAVRRGGEAACAISAAMKSAGSTIYGLLTFPTTAGRYGAMAYGGVDSWYYTTTLSATGLWSVAALPSALTVVPDGGAAIAGNLFPDQCATLNEKTVFCTPKGNAHTRLGLFEDGQVRLAGFGSPASITATNTGSGAYATTLRYYRVRFTTQSAGVTTRRSEPSADVSITPSGSGAGVLVTRPSLLGEGETHWEVEVSLDDANWYLLATVAVASLDYTDNADTATYSSGTVSEEPGARLAPGQCRTVITDRDRFIFGGHWTDEALKNRVWFTPVLGTTDVADEECVPSDNYVDVAAGDGDKITALLMGPNNDVLVFKERGIYRLLRTGIAAAPYEVSDAVVTGVGTRTPRHVCGGLDAQNNTCVYVSDVTGYWRYGVGGLQRLGAELHTGHLVPPSRVVYYRTRHAVLFGEMVYHLDTDGWSRMSWDGAMLEYLVTTPHYLTDFEDSEGDLLYAPGTGLPSIRQLDTGTTDLDFMNVASTFVARVGLSRRLLAAGQRWAPSRCVVWGSGGARLNVQVARDADPVTDADTYDTDTLEQVGVALLPETRGTGATQPIGLGVGSVRALGVWLEDPEGASTGWRLDAVELSGLPAEPLP